MLTAAFIKSLSRPAKIAVLLYEYWSQLRSRAIQKHVCCALFLRG